MAKFPLKTIVAVSGLLAATAYAFAQMSSGGPVGMQGYMHGNTSQMHGQMIQRQGEMPAGAGGTHGGGMASWGLWSKVDTTSRIT